MEILISNKNITVIVIQKIDLDQFFNACFTLKNKTERRSIYLKFFLSKHAHSELPWVLTKMSVDPMHLANNTNASKSNSWEDSDHEYEERWTFSWIRYCVKIKNQKNNHGNDSRCSLRSHSPSHFHISCNPLAISPRKLPAAVPKGVYSYCSSSPVKAAKLKLQTISLHGCVTEEHPPAIIITSR